MKFSLSNIGAQNSPNIVHAISVWLLFIITVSAGAAAACVATPAVFGAATLTILHISVGITTAGGILKLGLATLGGNVNPNNITGETANATVDTAKPTTPAPTK